MAVIEEPLNKICFKASVRGAYSCLWHYKIQHLMISLFAALPFCIAGLSGILDPVYQAGPSTEAVQDEYHMALLVLILTTFVWAIPSLILWHRLFLLGPEHLIRKKFWPMLTRSFRLIFKILSLMGGLTVIFAIVFAGILYLVNVTAHMDDGSVDQIGRGEAYLYGSALVIFILCVFAFAMRFSLAFCAQSIGKPMGFMASWKLTRHNTLPMMWGCFLALLPLVVGIFAVREIIMLGGNMDIFLRQSTPTDNLYWLILAVAPILTLPIAAICSQTAFFYRECNACDHREM